MDYTITPTTIESGGHYQQNSWKNFMTNKLLHPCCTKKSLRVVKAKIYDNGTTYQEDCLTLFRKTS